MMQIEKIKYGNWNTAYRCVHNSVELIVVTEIGPRILCFRYAGGDNILYEDTTGWASGDFKLYGGHRFTVAPETTDTIEADNTPCEVACGQQSLRISCPVGCHKIQRILEIGPCTRCGGFELRHILRNVGDVLWQGAAWALTAVRPEGSIIVPWGLGTDRWRINKICYWASIGDFNRCADSSLWRMTRDAVIVEPNGEKSKIGMYSDRGWMALSLKDSTFLKRYDPAVSESLYPDGGCNVEIYTCREFAEMETLGISQIIYPGDESVHIECWCLKREVYSREFLDNMALHSA
jgi:hypothetical protein